VEYELSSVVVKFKYCAANYTDCNLFNSRRQDDLLSEGKVRLFVQYVAFLNAWVDLKKWAKPLLLATRLMRLLLNMSESSKKRSKRRLGLTAVTRYRTYACVCSFANL